MTRKGGVATCEALARHGSALRFPQRLATVMGWGMDPCPEPETRAGLNLSFDFGERSWQRLGIVTRKDGNSNEVNDSVRKANRACKSYQTALQLLLVVDVEPAAIHEKDSYLFANNHNQELTSDQFYSIYHRGYMTGQMWQICGWAYLRWSINRYRENEEILEPEMLINHGAWLALRIQGLGGMAAHW